MSVRIEKGKTIRAIAYDLTVMTGIMVHVDENIMRAIDLPTRVHYLVVPPRALASRGYFRDLASGQKRRPGVGVEAGNVLDGICEDWAFCSVEVREKRVNDGREERIGASFGVMRRQRGPRKSWTKSRRARKRRRSTNFIQHFVHDIAYYP